MKTPVNHNHPVDVAFALANVWLKKGKPGRAIVAYKEILNSRHDFVPAYTQLGNVLLQQGRLPEAVDIFCQALDRCPNEAGLHKSLVNALVARSGLDAAFEYYALERRDANTIDIKAANILCCVVLRNEAPRLPYFLSYYRQRGITRFLVVDNDSTDEGLSYLLDQPDVYTWHSARSFNSANFGAGWFEVLLRRYGTDHWCLIVDADELLCYPECERKSIGRLCGELDRKHKKAFSAVLLDMYSDRAIKDTHYMPGQDFLEACPYFDRQFFHTKYEKAGPYKNQTGYFGGVRQRIFDEDGGYYLSKVPLLKYNPDFILAGGQHWTNRPETEIAAERGCLLHFKFFSSFYNYALQEVKRQEHYGNALQYKMYAEGLAQDEGLSLYDKNLSVKFENSKQLVKLGIMSTDEVREDRPRNMTAIEFPAIAPGPAGVHRPLWSVMITVYNRTEYIAHALRSVLAQAPGPGEMQIEVVNDSTDKRVHDEIEAIVRAVGGDRVAFHRLPSHAGHPRIFNICIEKAHGRWVHLLHDDDWVKPGFYRALQTGFETEPGIGAAFCRHLYFNETDRDSTESWLERETPGIIHDWLDRIAIMCRLQAPAIVVGRHVYDNLGGYCVEAKSAFDWEMWKRIAARYPVWYEPEPLAVFRGHTTSESSHLIRSGQQIADTLKAIEISELYLPEDRAGLLTARAREHYAGYALDLAKEQLKTGDYQAALANIRQALTCSRSERTKEALVALLLQYERDNADKRS